MRRPKSFSAIQPRRPLANRVTDFCKGAAVSAPSFARVSFTPDKQPQNAAESPTLTLEVTVRSGRRIWVDLSTLVFKDGRTHPRLVVHLSRDITERKHNEDLLHKMLQLSKQIIAVSDGNGIGRLAPVSSLSEQEQSILRMFSDGKNSGEIARALGISLQTLRNHLHHVNDKLGTHSRLQAVMHAMHRKLI